MADNQIFAGVLHRRISGSLTGCTLKLIASLQRRLLQHSH